MRKKIISILLASIFIVSAGLAQSLHAGIKAGTDIQKLSGKSFDEEFKFGYHIGVFAEIKLNTIGIQPELYFSQVNSQNGTDANSVLHGVNNHIKLSYLNIPLLVNVKFSKNVAIQLGPQYGILVNQDLSAQQNVHDAFKKGDFSLNGGLQLKVLKFRIYGRYNVGLNNLNDISSTEKWKSQSFHIGVGYAIL